MPVRQLIMLAVVAIGLMVLQARPVMAQDASIGMTQVIDTASAVTLAPMVATAAPTESAVPAPIPTAEVSTGKRRTWFLSIHVLSVAVQGLDAHSTIQALRNHSVEENAVTKQLTGNKVALVAVKAGMAAAVVYATERLSKRHPVAALLTAAAVNSAYLTIAATNYRSGRAQEARFGR